MRTTVLLFLLWCAASPAVLPAQSTANEIEALLGTGAVTYGQAARFILEASEVTRATDPAQAFQYAAQREWLPKDVSKDDPAQLSGISLLIMSAFDLKGGLFYSLTKNSHYAYRELVYKEIIQGRTDPDMPVSGDSLLFITSRVLSQQEEDAVPAAESPPVEKIDQLALKAALAEEINIELEQQQIADARATVTDKGVEISLSNVQFLPDSILLSESEKTKLQGVANILRNIPGRRIMITGHSAMAGTTAGQLAVSRGRAQAVADYLIELGVRTRTDIVVVGAGAESSVGDNTTAAGMAANRRVEITILED